MRENPNIGTIIGGFCNGFFGRDDYQDKVIVFETKYSICCRYLKDPNYLTVATFDSEREKNNYVYEWSKEYEQNYEEENY